jgi:hypothetical protein
MAVLSDHTDPDEPRGGRRRPDPYAKRGPRNDKIMRRRKAWLHVLLFFVMLLTTSVAAAYQNGVGLSAMIADPSEIAAGFPFSFKLMALLLSYAWLKEPS